METKRISNLLTKTVKMYAKVFLLRSCLGVHISLVHIECMVQLIMVKLLTDDRVGNSY